MMIRLKLLLQSTGFSTTLRELDDYDPLPIYNTMQPASVLPRLNEKDNFRRLIGELVSTGDPVILEAKYRELALVLSSQIKIAETHWQDFQRFLHLKIRQPDSLFLKELPNMAAFIFSSRSPLVHTIYESIPDLLIVFQRSLQLNVEDMSQRLKGMPCEIFQALTLSSWEFTIILCRSGGVIKACLKLANCLPSPTSLGSCSPYL